MLWESASLEEYYPGLGFRIYAPKWYYSKEVKHDRYSMNLWYSKDEDKSDFFRLHINNLISELQEEGILNLNDFDLITIIPGHKPNRYSVTLEKLAKEVSMKYEITYDRVIIRVRDTHIGGHRASELEKRYEHVQESMIAPIDLSGKNILLLDDIKTTGITLLEAKKILLNEGAEEIIAICLGINSNEDKEHIKNMINYDEEGRRWVRNV